MKKLYEEIQENLAKVGVTLLTKKKEYVDTQTKIKVRGICGHEYEAYYHQVLGRNKVYCPICGRKILNGRRKSKEKFIEDAVILHGNKYDYSKFYYLNSSTKGIIICPTHGVFKQTPRAHLIGRGCFKCGLEKNSKKLHEKGEGHIDKHGYRCISLYTKDLYKYVYNPKRNYKKNIGVLYEHIYVMAKHLGRPIDTTKESIHHKNGIKDDNRITNLELRESYHGKGHTEKENLQSSFSHVCSEIESLSKRDKNKLRKLLEEK